jgi:hypothetical protein
MTKRLIVSGVNSELEQTRQRARSVKAVEQYEIKLSFSPRTTISFTKPPQAAAKSMFAAKTCL